MASNGFAETPANGYYAVIFTSKRAGGGGGYAEMADRMVELASTQPGFLGVDSARGDDGLAITVSYRESEESIAEWKQHVEHIEAQRRGMAEWYDHYEVRIARVERSYGRALKG